MNTDIQKNIRRVLIVFLFLFIALISYIGYFQLFKAESIASSDENKRLWAKRNEVTRGVIYDRDNEVLAETVEKRELSQKRSYPQGELFAHVVGYYDETYSLAGLENTFDEELISYSVVESSISSLLDFFNLKKAFNTRTEEEIKVGNSLITTLDTDIQRAAYQALGTNKGAVVVLNPKTGEILASVSKPSYDPNNLSEIWETINTDTVNTPMFNRATRGLYPPGSTFKVVTLASALENISGVTSKVFNDKGKIIFSDNKTTLSNYNNNVYGQLSLKKALSVSSNVVFGELAMDLGNDKLKATAEKFGFNKTFSGSGIPIESSRFPEYNSSQEGLIAQSGIGQAGILSTPMEMAMVAAAVANDGAIIKPNIIKEIKTSSGKTVRELRPEVLYEAISPENAAIIKDYMVGVVQDRIGSSWANVFNGLNAAGKTGTADYEVDGVAQVPHSWFIGFAPADDPQVAIAVIVENGGTGSTMAAQVSGKVLKAALGQ